MYTPENYIWGCVAYVMGVLMLMPLLWWATRPVSWHLLRGLLRMLILALLLTPAFPYEGVSYLAPAWATAAFELIKPTMEHGVRRVLLPIGFSFSVFFGLYLCIWQLLKNRVSQGGVATAEDGP
ncbi:hypothetical protein A9Q89_00275 [Gammaproteobacteria bacterium 53_120_T64]|nr:hypothetical protein A9Q89_00275 [Gammaproteobacteria bacterium 53_120_T64]